MGLNPNLYKVSVHAETKGEGRLVTSEIIKAADESFIAIITPRRNGRLRVSEGKNNLDE